MREFYNSPFCRLRAHPPHLPVIPVNFIVQNWYLVLAALVSGGLLLWPAVARSTGGASRVSPAEAVTLINRERAVIVDVGEPAEYAGGHAGGARNVPFGSLESSNDLPKNKALPVVLMCPTGARAARAVAILKKRGYERVSAVAGGLAAWRDANLPVEKAA
jgi:rhodanese-related sulfurtransferase